MFATHFCKFTCGFTILKLCNDLLKKSYSFGLYIWYIHIYFVPIYIQYCMYIRLFANIHLANALFYIIRLPINTEKHNSASFYVDDNCSKPSLSRINHPTEASPCQLQQALLSRQSHGSDIFTMQVRLHRFNNFFAVFTK